MQANWPAVAATGFKSSQGDGLPYTADYYFSAPMTGHFRLPRVAESSGLTQMLSQKKKGE